MSRISRIVMNENTILTPKQQESLSMSDQLTMQISKLKKTPAHQTYTKPKAPLTALSEKLR